MEKYFKPVHGPVSPEELKNRKQHHQSHHHYASHSQRCTSYEDSDRSPDDNLRHRYHPNVHDIHGNHQFDSLPLHHKHQYRRTQNHKLMYDREKHVSPCRASSSSLSSSSSSSSFSSWYTETSANEPFSARSADRPQHSLSCSNIAEGRRIFRDDESREPIVFATIKHGSNACSGESKLPRGRPVLSTLERGHSRSFEGLQGNDCFEPSEKPDFGPLYKTSSLNRSLAFSEEDIMLGASQGPKRAVSSTLLPSKGILKNKAPSGDVRKARSMEVLSPRVAKEQTDSVENKQAEIEQAREHFLQGKLRFSAFLDEITKQVISPSNLTMLGVNSPTSAPAPTSAPVKPQLPVKKSSRNKDKNPQQSNADQWPGSRAQKKTNTLDSDKLVCYAARNHQGSPPPQHYSSSRSAQHGKTRREKRPSPLGSSMSGDRHGRFGPHLTDGTSTSPETIQPKHCSLNTPHTSAPLHQGPQGHASLSQQGSGTSSPFSSEGAGIGFGSESSSVKSDSSRAKDKTSKGTSTDPHLRAEASKLHGDTVNEINHLQALQEENADLQQNLLQTVVCIESLETELQRTRDELSSVKEKYKSLLETHTGTRQANNILGEHLHIASESLNNERRFLLNQVSQLSSELEDAHKTIAALENINVPCLIKELLEKHWNTTETMQKFMAMNDGGTAAHAPTVNGEVHKCVSKSDVGPQRPTAFMPFRQALPTQSEESEPTYNTDMSDAIYENIAARPQPVCPSKYTESSRNPTQVFGDHPQQTGEEDIKVSLLEEDVVPLTSVSAQHILDEFMQQLQGHQAAGGMTEWAGKAADRQLHPSQYESI
ncbi:uncharacterized protein si:ch211-276i12.4 isoform X1 [Synchiropus splendidus]|uniref:uncharacterized protein si:ch211-276i12.4 isoform X1 n=2 Tax=Synchiropus splendidus TaxID=270530 RepID=UPI00237E0654|nr:uncharacterized protein si:ch211-276i12.4 isoform X1 [Synchiropus splendidus]